MKLSLLPLKLLPLPVLAAGITGLPAQAAIITYQSTVNVNNPIVGTPPPLTGSPTTTRNNFLTAAGALGTVSTVTFEGLANNNFYSSGSGSINVSPATGPGGQVNISINGGTGTFNPENGINNFSGDQAYGFNTTNGGNTLLRINPRTSAPQTVTSFSFAAPVSAFGLFITDYGNTNNGTLTPRLNLVGGGTLNLAQVTRSVSVNNSISSQNRSVLFYGFTIGQNDPLISSVDFVHAGVTSLDRYGFDDISFVQGRNTPPPPPLEVPEPSLILGTLAVGGASFLLKKKKR